MRRFMYSETCRPLKTDKTKTLKTSGSLVQAKVLQNTPPEYSAILIGLENIFCSIFSDRLRQVLLYFD